MSVEKEFTWRGLQFIWNGRRRMWICERPRHQSHDWWVTHQFYERSHYLKRLDEIDWDNPPSEDHPELQIFANMGYIAHLGHGDAAVRSTRLDALEGALQYALRFHHSSLAELRKVLFAPEVTT